MKKILISIKAFLLDIFFPRFCLSCGKEGSYLCQDCQALLEVSEEQHCLCKEPFTIFGTKMVKGKCRKCRGKILHGLYSALPYENFLTKRLIQQFKYPPYFKGLANTLASLIITHFHLLDKPPDFSRFVLLPVPLHKSKLRERGFNQSEEIAKELGKFLRIPVVGDSLLKIKETQAQVELSESEREENIKGAFFCQKPEEVRSRKILLVDDIYTTGATMEECGRVLKKAGAQEVWGVVVARG